MALTVRCDWCDEECRRVATGDANITQLGLIVKGREYQFCGPNHLLAFIHANEKTLAPLRIAVRSIEDA